MSNSFKVTLYALLVLLAGLSGYFALTSFRNMMAHAGERNSALEQIEPERKPPAETENTPETISTNTAGTNVASVLSTNGSNDLSLSTNVAVTTVSTNETTNTVAETQTSKKSKTKKSVQTAEEKTSGHLGLWTALFVISLIGLGLLIAGDVSHYFGNRALKVLYNDEGEGMKDPEYDKAEEVWANGEHLEAIKMMREYLAKNPRQQHVSIRIAEIYEKDLGNNLAAALEYEEVLKQKLQPERWGWAAIHLCNLYFRLGQEQKGFDLLRRIVSEFPNTAAAEKARKRLEQVDSTAFTEQLTTEQNVSAAPKSVASSGPPSNLPPGFRPKK
jgi:TolA-binding protein